MEKIYKLKELLKESKIESLNPDPNKRIRVRLNVLGVEKRPVENEVKGATKQFVRKAGQFIYGKQNLHKGAFGIVPQELDGFETSSDIPSFDVNNEIVLTEYIYYFFKGGNRYLSLESMAKGVGSKRIQPKELLELDINVPTKDIQEKLIKKLQALEMDGEIVSTEITHQLDLIKNLRQAFLREAMQGLLVSNETSDNKTGADLLAEIQAEKAQLVKEKKIKKPKPLAPITEDELKIGGSQIPFDIPKNWTWCRLGEVIELKSGQDLTPSQYNDKGNGIPYITGASNLENEKVIINRWTETPKSLSYNGDLLLTCKGSGVGKTAFLDIEVVHIARQIMAINTYKTSLNYIYIIVKSSVELFKAKSKSLIPGIDRDTVLEVLLPLPPLEIQERIVAKLDELMGYCDALEEQVKQSQQTNELLLQQVLREALGA